MPHESAPQRGVEDAKLLTRAREQWGNFEDRFGKTINAYFGTPEIQFTMKPGGWYVDLKSLQVNADPEFFLEKGYSEGEALFATFHEAEHFRDMAMDPDAYDQLFDHAKSRDDVHPAYPQALQRFYNCLEDVMVNKVVMSRWESAVKAKDSLYPKLFPKNDFRGIPRHRQLMYALLRQAMLPQEEAFVDEDVSAAMNTWQNRTAPRKEKSLDLLTGVDPRGQARLSATERYRLIGATLEPIFEQFFRQDLQDKKQEKENGQPGEPQEGEGDPFGADEFEDAIPDPLDLDEVADQIKHIKEQRDQNKKNEFEQVMGVSLEDFEAYRRDLKLVEPHIEALSAVWDGIIQRRISYRRKLDKPLKEGPLLDPRKTAIGLAEMQAGHLDPTMMLGYRKHEQKKQQPNRIEITLVCDGSGSMKDGSKDVMQRRMAVLTAESLEKFQQRLNTENAEGRGIDLQLKSEVRIFADQDKVIKPLSPSLTHPERVRMHKELASVPGGSNNEPDTFEKMFAQQMKPPTLSALHKGDLKKLIVFYTDGQTDVVSIQGWIKRFMKTAGKDGQKNLVVAGLGFGDGQQAVETYAPNGKFASELKDVPLKYKEIIEQFMADV